jgi:hypothetical protein
MSTKRAAIKKIENRIAVLSKEDPTKNEQVIREFESLRESLLLLNPNEEEEEEYVDLQLLTFKMLLIQCFFLMTMIWTLSIIRLRNSMIAAMATLFSISVRRLRSGFNGLLTPMVMMMMSPMVMMEELLF